MQANELRIGDKVFVDVGDGVHESRFVDIVGVVAERDKDRNLLLIELPRKFTIRRETFDRMWFPGWEVRVPIKGLCPHCFAVIETSVEIKHDNEYAFPCCGYKQEGRPIDTDIPF